MAFQLKNWQARNFWIICFRISNYGQKVMIIRVSLDLFNYIEDYVATNNKLFNISLRNFKVTTLSTSCNSRNKVFGTNYMLF